MNKSIIIRQMSLLNFKGVLELTVDFDEHETNVYGANHTGKTTLFDAFIWLMFDKDSQDRQNFGIRTYDEDNNIIPKLPHEVSACIEVNGVEINLKRCFVENWVKKRGSQEAVYDGNSEERYWNDVPCSKTEFAKKIASLTPGNLNKMLFAPGGAEANSMAIKLARVVTGRYKTISMWDSFHGATLDTISLSGEAVFRKGIGPLMCGDVHVPPPDIHRRFMDITSQSQKNLKA